MQIIPGSVKLLTEFTAENCLTHVLLYELNRVFERLGSKLGCTYASYVLESELTGKKLQLSTNTDWGNYFYFKNLVQDCPIVYALRKINLEAFKNSTLIWNAIKPHTRKERLIVGLRGEFSVSNGVTFTSFLSNRIYGCYLEAISFAGDKIDINFYKEVLQNKKIISALVYNLRCKGYKALTAENDKLFKKYIEKNN